MINIDPANGGIQIGYNNISTDTAKIRADSKTFYHLASAAQTTPIILGGGYAETHTKSISTPGTADGDIYLLTINITSGSGSFISKLQSIPIQVTHGIVYNYSSDFIAGDGEIVIGYDVLTYRYSFLRGYLEITTTGRASPRITSGVFGGWADFNERYTKTSIGFTYTLDIYSFE